MKNKKSYDAGMTGMNDKPGPAVKNNQGEVRMSDRKTKYRTYQEPIKYDGSKKY